MFFRLGGGTFTGVCKPGEVVWSRVFIEENELHVDLGRATTVELPAEETAKRWRLTTPQWPMMHVNLPGVSRDQFMAGHRANHVRVAYAPPSAAASKPVSARMENTMPARTPLK
jgi:hypothetical protein